jgi:hypothetical protein
MIRGQRLSTGRSTGLPIDMASYFYVIKNGTNDHDDEDGTILRDDREATIYALRIIRELKKGGGY